MSIQDLLTNGLGQIQSDGDIRGAFQHILNSGAVGGSPGLQPAIDIVETKNNLYVYVELPGVSESSIDIDFYNNKVVISGEKLKRYTEIPVKKEIVYGKFHRKIILPISVTNQENVMVRYKNGVLVLTVDKQREEQHRFRIGVSSREEPNVPGPTVPFD